LEREFAAPASQYRADRAADELVYTQASPLCSDRANDPTCDAEFLTAESVLRRFFVNVLSAPDQLRRCVAFALQQILVVSNIDMRPTYCYCRYPQILLDYASRSYLDLLARIMLSAAIGR
jgi:hypothetical protein